MPKLTKKAIRLWRTDVRTDPKYRKASLLKIENYSMYSIAQSRIYARWFFMELNEYYLKYSSDCMYVQKYRINNKNQSTIIFMEARYWLVASFRLFCKRIYNLSLLNLKQRLMKVNPLHLSLWDIFFWYIINFKKIFSLAIKCQQWSPLFISILSIDVSCQQNSWCHYRKFRFIFCWRVYLSP